MVKLYYNQKIEHSCSLKARLISPTGTTVQSLSSPDFSVLKGQVPQSMVSPLSLVLVQVYTSLQSLSIVSALRSISQFRSFSSCSSGPSIQVLQFSHLVVQFPQSLKVRSLSPWSVSSSYSLVLAPQSRYFTIVTQ